ncbi:TPA: hypothetical protein N0F65_007567 [Lagenidium giganteum]|uniref:Uncharacterized protein n=1 Tax=Lagenidium giganteum TaxID=4803 RepID=A0AAV2ZSS4_9STRA|nr:TPA: hypothetical protein N0F65_007567 [Lagenidium giganteum]
MIPRRLKPCSVATMDALLISPDDEDEFEIGQQQIRDEIRRIPQLKPWTTYVARDPTFSQDLNKELATRVEGVVLERLEQMYTRLKKKQGERDAAGIHSKRANQTLLENQIFVEAKRKIDLAQVTDDMRAAIRTAMAMIKPQVMITARANARRATGPRWRDNSLFALKLSEQKAAEAAALADKNGQSTNPFRSGPGSRGTVNENSDLIFVQFPTTDKALSQLVADADARLTAEDLDKQVTNFRNRPVSQSAIDDAGRPTSRRTPSRDRVRYIMSSRFGALPPTKNILEEYPIPKEIIDALERHRHYHIDESSLMTSFDAVKAGSSDWECYYRRSVPVERKPISFVLSSLEIAPERPVAPPSDIFYQNMIDSATNEDMMLTEVRQLYDHTHEAYRDFRNGLHKHLDLEYLVDLSFRSSLNSTSYFLEDEVTSSETTVKIPEHLLKTTNPISRWRLARKGVTRISSRRGALAMHIKTESFNRKERGELLHKLCTFTDREVQLMDLWYSNETDAPEVAFDPIPMAPDLSARFDLLWRDLQMPAQERLDLALKYSSLDNSSRLPDAVRLWEVCAALIREREDLLRVLRAALAAQKKTIAMIAEEPVILQDLVTCTMNLKEALMLTYIEVGDFVTLSGNFYMARMEHESAELRRLIVDSFEGSRRKLAVDGTTTTEVGGDIMNRPDGTSSPIPDNKSESGRSDTASVRSEKVTKEPSPTKTDPRDKLNAALKAAQASRT